MADVGGTVLHHHAVGSKVTGVPPLPPQSNPNWADSHLTEAASSPLPQEVDNVTQPGAQLSGMFHMGNTVPLHHVVEPPVADVSPTPHPKKLILWIVILWIAWLLWSSCAARSPLSRAGCAPGAAGRGRWVGRTG